MTTDGTDPTPPHGDHLDPDHLTRDRRAVGVRVVQVAMTLAVLALLFGLAIPRLGGGYGDVWHLLEQLEPSYLVVLTAVWAIGIWLYALSWTLCLPGLRQPQSVVVNLAGSAAANVVPFGGAVGVGITYGMTMSWGHPATAVSAAILTTGLFNFFVGLALPVLALALLATEGQATWQLAVPAGVGLAALIGSIAFLALLERSDGGTERLGDRLQQMGNWIAVRLHLRHDLAWKHSLLDFRQRTAAVVRDRWRPVLAAIIGYRFSQYVLLLLCVHAVDPATPLTRIEVFAAYAFGRILATVPITPGGVGMVETGSIAALVVLGGGQAESAAAVLLFSAFVYALEIPLGALAWAWWATRRSWRHPRPSPPVPAGQDHETGSSV